MTFEQLTQEWWWRVHERHFAAKRDKELRQVMQSLRMPRIWKPCLKCGKRTYAWSWVPRTMVHLICAGCASNNVRSIPAPPEEWVR